VYDGGYYNEFGIQRIATRLSFLSPFAVVLCGKRMDNRPFGIPRAGSTPAGTAEPAWRRSRTTRSIAATKGMVDTTTNLGEYNESLPGFRSFPLSL